MRARLQRRRRASDRGASAVEFALVMPLLFAILLGVIQFGYGLFQLQNFNSIVDDASQVAGTGIDSCTTFTTQMKNLSRQNGIDPASITAIDVDWLQVDPATPPNPSSPAQVLNFITSPNAARQGMAQVTMTFKPFNLGFIPFPSTITRTKSAPVQDLGTLLGGC